MGLCTGIVQYIATEDGMWLARGLSIWWLLTLAFWLTAYRGEKLIMSALMLIGTVLTLATWKLVIGLIGLM